MSLRDHLQAIYDERGVLTPALVVDVARDDQHPLHPRFEWNDTVAAERFRREQAHILIKSVHLTYVSTRTQEPISIRAFHAVRRPDINQYAYEPTQVIMQDPMAMRLLLTEMRRDWAAFRRRYEEFEEFWTMIVDDARVLEELNI